MFIFNNYAIKLRFSNSSEEIIFARDEDKKKSVIHSYLKTVLSNILRC